MPVLSSDSIEPVYPHALGTTICGGDHDEQRVSFISNHARLNASELSPNIKDCEGNRSAHHEIHFIINARRLRTGACLYFIINIVCACHGCWMMMVNDVRFLSEERHHSRDHAATRATNFPRKTLPWRGTRVSQNPGPTCGRPRLDACRAAWPGKKCWPCRGHRRRASGLAPTWGPSILPPRPPQAAPPSPTS